MPMFDSQEIVALCNRFGYLGGTYEWEYDELIAAGWDRKLILLLELVAKTMEDAVARQVVEVRARAIPLCELDGPLRDDDGFDCEDVD